MNPKSGGRAVLDFVAEEAGIARFRAALFVPDASFESDAVLTLSDGAVTFGPWTGGEPPAWLLKYALTFLRSAWRERTRDPSVPWVARINRWREERG